MTNQINTIYRITNTINNKVYIGQTWRKISERWYEHQKPSATGCIKLHYALDKYGRDKFIIESLVTCDNQNTADYLERFWIKIYNSCKMGYNISEGGATGKLSEETKRKISLANKGMRLGAKHSEEAKQKMKDKRKLQKAPAFKLSQLDKDNIVFRCSNGESQASVAKIYKVDPSAISRVMSNHGH